MTTLELNRDYRRLFKASRELSKLYNETKDAEWKNHGYWTELDILKKEFIRLYLADTGFKYINRTSIIIFLSLNQRWRVFAFHSIHPDTDKL